MEIALNKRFLKKQIVLLFFYSNFANDSNLLLTKLIKAK